jgi:hypothetical protein
VLSGASPPDPFILNDSIPIAQGTVPYRVTSGLTMRSQSFNPALKNLVLIGAGQSNATSLLPSAYTPASSSVIDVMNIYDGAFYGISGPLPGTPYPPSFGAGGNVLSMLAQNCITGGWDRVILVPIAIGGTTAADWATGTLSSRIPVALRRLASRGYTVGATGLTFAISWWQGETDTTNGTSQASYAASMATVLANAQAQGFTGSNSRLFVNRETWISGTVSAAVQAAQVALPNGTTIFAGGNIDSLNAANRVADNTHFNDAGAAAAATLVYNAMVASGAPY